MAGVILMKLYTVVVYDLRMCMKEDNSGQKYHKGDNSKEIITSVVQDGVGVFQFVNFDKKSSPLLIFYICI